MLVSEQQFNSKGVTCSFKETLPNGILDFALFSLLFSESNNIQKLAFHWFIATTRKIWLSRACKGVKPLLPSHICKQKQWITLIKIYFPFGCTISRAALAF